MTQQQGDIVIDGGNSHFKDTTRRVKELEAHGLLYVGSGVSGGEEVPLLLHVPSSAIRAADGRLLSS